ncbi:MAG: PEP-CTERM sorting domain-containing protein [Pseudomonadota bacterium]
MKLIPRLILACMVSAVAPAYAGVVEYQDFNQFQTAAPNGVTETFEGRADPASFVDVSNSTLGNLSYSANTFIVDSAFDGGGYQWGTGAVLLLDNYGVTTLSFAPTKSFSALFGTVIDFGQNITVDIDNTLFLISTGAFANWTFYGWVSDTEFSSISFTSTTGLPLLDDVFLGHGGSTGVPEPASLAMLALGLLGIGAGRRRQAK